MPATSLMNWISLQRSEMFIATNVRPKDLASLGAKRASASLWQEKHCAPLERGTK
jgi:hypothetical protein